ncbi:Uncharacterised protein [uncultured archaeon]|nr:Uncharacterised protein [uncultured archaeon]
MITIQQQLDTSLFLKKIAPVLKKNQAVGRIDAGGTRGFDRIVDLGETAKVLNNAISGSRLNLIEVFRLNPVVDVILYHFEGAILLDLCTKNAPISIRFGRGHEYTACCTETDGSDASQFEKMANLLRHMPDGQIRTLREAYRQNLRLGNGNGSAILLLGDGGIEFKEARYGPRDELFSHYKRAWVAELREHVPEVKYHKNFGLLGAEFDDTAEQTTYVKHLGAHEILPLELESRAEKLTAVYAAEAELTIKFLNNDRLVTRMDNAEIKAENDPDNPALYRGHVAFVLIEPDSFQMLRTARLTQDGHCEYIQLPPAFEFGETGGPLAGLPGMLLPAGAGE